LSRPAFAERFRSGFQSEIRPAKATPTEAIRAGRIFWCGRPILAAPDPRAAAQAIVDEIGAGEVTKAAGHHPIFSGPPKAISSMTLIELLTQCERKARHFRAG